MAVTLVAMEMDIKVMVTAKPVLKKRSVLHITRLLAIRRRRAARMKCDGRRKQFGSVDIALIFGIDENDSRLEITGYRTILDRDYPG